LLSREAESQHSIPFYSEFARWNPFLISSAILFISSVVCPSRSVHSRILHDHLLKTSGPHGRARVARPFLQYQRPPTLCSWSSGESSRSSEQSRSIFQLPGRPRPNDDASSGRPPWALGLGVNVLERHKNLVHQ